MTPGVRSAGQPHHRRHIVIIGGGFGGLNAARALARAAVRVTLIDRENHHLFQPLLYQVATAGLSPGDIASPIRWILRRQRNVQVLLAEVRGVDVERRMVSLDADHIVYDFLIVAAGATHTYFGHDVWAKSAPGLKTLDDALQIRRRILLAFERAERETNEAYRRRLLTFVVIGGGPTGVELAGALAELARHTLRHEFRSIEAASARIVLLEAGPTVLPAFPRSLQERASRDLDRLGVEVRTGAMVSHVARDHVQIAVREAVPPGREETTRRTAVEKVIEAGTIVWAAGVAASPLGRSFDASLDRVGRVKVLPDLSVAGHPEVFVIGDQAAFEQDGRLLPGVAQVAIQMGRHAAANIRAVLEGRTRRPFRYRDLGNMATIGRASAVADFGWLRLAGWPAWLTWLFVHVIGLIGFRNRLVVLVQWAWAYVTHQRGARLITGTEERDA